jgi:predicted Zn-dependent protease
LEEAAHVEPQNPYVWASLAETYLRLKEPAKASEAAAKAEKGSEGDPPVAHALAMYYRETGDLAHAARLEERYRAAEWEKAKTDPKIAFDYVQVLLRREDFARAAEVTSAALEAHPNDAQLVLALGVARYGQRRFEDAVNLFLRVIQIDPNIEQPYVFLGKMLEQAGSHLAEITKAYEGWATTNPDNAVAQLLWGKALLAANARAPRAEQLLRRSITLDDNNWQSHYELGVLLADKRDYQAAATELNRSIALDPKQALPHYHLARVYDRLGEPERAKAERELHQQLTAPKAQ